MSKGSRLDEPKVDVKSSQNGNEKLNATTKIRSTSP